MGLIAESDVVACMRERHDNTEFVLTGRGATAGLIAAADLVTEMVPVKHYHDQGVAARTGIEK